MENHEDSNSYLDDLRAQNAVLRLKLEIEHGMKDSSIGRLGPQIENMWLNSILSYEQKLKTAPRMTVQCHLGNPQIRKWDQLSPKEISRELWKLLDLMRSKRIILDCLHEVDDLVLYRFITEELVNEEIMVLSDSNFAFHFVYEEFHPDRTGDTSV